MEPIEYAHKKLKEHVDKTPDKDSVMGLFVECQAERDFYRSLCRKLWCKVFDEEIITAVDEAVEYLNL